MRLLFDTFRETGSACAVVRRLRGQKILFPRRLRRGIGKGDLLWSAIDHKRKHTDEPARLRYLRRRPEAALTADRYSDDWSDLAWVQALGHVDVLAATDAPRALAALVARYEPYKRESPPGPLLRLTPARFLYWHAAL